MTDLDSPLYQLLPQLYRLRDTEHDQQLEKLLHVLAENHAELERDLATLYDNWFIETCAPEVIPALGALVGAHDLSGTALDRALVADAATLSGAKGTLTALETLTADLVGWPTRVFEAAATLAVLASARFPDILPRQLPDLRRTDAGQAGYARRTSRLPDVRDVGSPRTRGRGKMSSVLVVLWRLRPDTTVDAAARTIGPGRYTFDPLGAPVQLAVRPVPRQPGPSWWPTSTYRHRSGGTRWPDTWSTTTAPGGASRSRWTAGSSRSTTSSSAISPSGGIAIGIGLTTATTRKTSGRGTSGRGTGGTSGRGTSGTGRSGIAGVDRRSASTRCWAASLSTVTTSPPRSG